MVSLELLNQLAHLPQDLRLIPVGGNKNPIEKDWTNKGLSPTDFIKKYQQRELNGLVQAVGVLTGKGYIAVDIDGPNVVKLVCFLAGSQTLSDALIKTVKFTSGKRGRQQALYRVPGQYRDKLPNILVITVKGEKLELRYNGHQSVLSGKHPETGSYKWIEGCSPQETEIADCPELFLKLAAGEPIELFTLLTPAG